MTWQEGAGITLWLALVLGLFWAGPPRRALLASLTLGWLFLPVVTYTVPHLPDLNKMNITCLGALGGVALFDPRRLVTFRPRWFDLPMLVFCATPLAAALSNGLGVYEGVSAVVARSIAWAIPYVLGRIYLTDAVALDELAWWVVVGGLLYVPLCWVEIVWGPWLHLTVYGHLHVDVEQAARFSGWRPTVFMQQGLMTAFWLMAASLVSFWVWWSRRLRRVGPLSGGWVVLVLSVTTVASQSINAWALGALGLAVLLVSVRWRWPWPVGLVATLVVGYLGLRLVGAWQAEPVVEWTGRVLGARRAQSVAFRFANEAVILQVAQSHPWFGLGRRGASVYPPVSGLPLVFDSLWIITLAESGSIALAALGVIWLTPSLAFAWRTPGCQWRTPELAGAAALSIVLLLYAIDSLLNAMVNPIYALTAGGLLSLVFGAAKPDKTYG